MEAAPDLLERLDAINASVCTTSIITTESEAAAQDVAVQSVVDGAVSGSESENDDDATDEPKGKRRLEMTDDQPRKRKTLRAMAAITLHHAPRTGKTLLALVALLDKKLPSRWQLLPHQQEMDIIKLK